MDLMMQWYARCFRLTSVAQGSSLFSDHLIRLACVERSAVPVGAVKASFDCLHTLDGEL